MENGGERELGKAEVEEAILLRPKNDSPCTPSKKAIINKIFIPQVIFVLAS